MTLPTPKDKALFTNYPDVVDVKQLSEMLNVSSKTCYKILKSGSLPFRRIGREYRISKYAVIEYLNTNGQV